MLTKYTYCSKLKVQIGLLIL